MPSKTDFSPLKKGEHKGDLSGVEGLAELSGRNPRVFAHKFVEPVQVIISQFSGDILDGQVGLLHHEFGLLEFPFFHVLGNGAPQVFLEKRIEMVV